MRQLTAYEHGWLEVGEGRELAPNEAEALAAAEGLLPAGCLQWGHRRGKFTQYCGGGQADGPRVEGLAKITPSQTEAPQRDTLLTMPTCARCPEGDDTLDQVRGRIDLVRQQRENLFKPQRLACRYSELIADIPVNRLLHSALRLVISLTTSPLLAQQLHALRMRFGEVGILAHHERGPTAEQLNRMQSRYAPLVALAHLFLDGQFLDARSGRQQAFSLLFDMNRLFERYTASRLRPLVRRHGLKLMEQGPRRYLGHEDSGRGRLLMRPDISLLDESRRPVVILDTKWKRIEGPDALAALSAADLYQLAAYASAYDCSSVVLLYPEQTHLRAVQRHAKI